MLHNLTSVIGFTSKIGDMTVCVCSLVCFFCGECAVGSIKEVGENVDMFSGICFKSG